MQFAWNPDHRADVTEGLRLVIRQDWNGESPVRYDGEGVYRRRMCLLTVFFNTVSYLVI